MFLGLGMQSIQAIQVIQAEQAEQKRPGWSHGARSALCEHAACMCWAQIPRISQCTEPRKAYKPLQPRRGFLFGLMCLCVHACVRGTCAVVAVPIAAMGCGAG